MKIINACFRLIGWFHSPDIYVLISAFGWVSPGPFAIFAEVLMSGCFFEQREKTGSQRRFYLYDAATATPAAMGLACKFHFGLLH
jgi:hypothetical protein